MCSAEKQDARPAAGLKIGSNFAYKTSQPKQSELLLTVSIDANSGPEVIKIFFMLKSTEHKILNVHKYKNIKKFGFLG